MSMLTLSRRRRRWASCFVAAGLCLLASGSMRAAEEAKPATETAKTGELPNGPLPGHSSHGEIYNEGPRQRAYLMGNVGNVNFPATSKHAEVQAFINQGVAQLHGFWYLEAERSFRHAAMLDGDCAIAYWGMAMANAENAKRARGFIAESVKRRDKASRREQLYIDGLAEFLKEPEKKKDDDKKPEGEKREGRQDREKPQEVDRVRRQKLVDSFETIIAEFPDDIEAKAFLGLHLWQSRSKNLAMPSHTAVNALFQEVIAANPKHPCHHYVIHLWDDKQAERAVKSAGMGGPSAPGIAHMWHMPGHTYSKLKRYHDAAWQQEASARVDHAHMMRDRLLPDQIHNFAHNNEWLIRDLIHNGDADAARDLALNMISLPRHPKWNTVDDGGSSAYFGRVRLLDVLQQFEMWGEVDRLLDSGAVIDNGVDAERVKLTQLRATAAFETGRPERGAELLTSLMEEKAKVEAEKADADAKAREKAMMEGKKPDEVEKAGKDAAGKLDGRTRSLDSAIDDLKGRLHLAHRAYGDALAAFEKTGRADKGFLARLQSLAGNSDKAIETAKRYVADNSKETIPLARQVDVLWMAGKKDEAKMAFEELRQISETVCLDAPVFSRLAPIAKELGYPDDWRQPLAARSDLGERPPLDSLGPAHWSPSPAPTWSLVDHANRTHSLSDYQGRSVLVLFYLGHGCLHCVEQLQKFAPVNSEFEQAGVEIIAIGSDDPAELQLACKNFGSEFPFPLVSNHSLDVFKAYRCFDDFEDKPLHGAFLIDAQGLVRWQDIGFEPYTDTKFLLEEAKRLLKK
jgi:peroxiredoxin